MKRFLISSVVTLCVFLIQGATWKEESALAIGSWYKIGVEQTGLHFISRNQLAKIGLTPESAHIYGFGGRTISESEPALTPDDLPPVACVRTADGIFFFGVGAVDIVSGSERIRNPYSSEGYFFVSDRKPDTPEIKSEKRIPGNSGRVTDSFTQRLLYEKELAMAANTGQLALGEDFRAKNSQNFDFSLPGKTNDEVDIAVKFATRTTNGSSSLFVLANGQRLPSTTTDNIAPVTSSERFIRTQLTEKKATVGGNDLTVGVQYIPGGAVFTARLDYIITSYLRDLRLESDPLLFELEAGITDARIEGFTDAHLWDITDPLSPVEIQGQLDGQTLTFSQSGSSGRRYIAWKNNIKLPEATLSPIIENQNLHGMGVPDMLIIAPAQYREAAERVAEIHRAKDGLEVAILTPTEIYNEFSSGTPDVGAYRRLMMMWRQRGGDKFRWCLLIGKPSNNPRRIGKANNSIEPVLIWQSEGEESQTTSFSTDDLIAMLDDSGAGFDMASAKLDIAVGRMPVSSPEEALGAAIKLERYSDNSDFGSWRNSALIIADDQDNGIHLEQAESVARSLQADGNGSDFAISKLYLDSYPLRLTPTGSSYPEAKEKMLKTWQNGVLLIDYIGHANTKSWGHEGLLNWADIPKLKTTRLPFVYAATCDFGRWDDDTDISGAEQMWAMPDGGAIGLITASRVVYINSNGVLNNSTTRRILTRDSSGKGRTIGEIYRDSKNGLTGADTNKLRYILMGDPAMRLLRPALSVEVDSISGIAVSDALATGDLPVLKAGSRVRISGRIVNSEGAIASDFNGFVEPSLYDAEMPMETLGNGADGRKMLYNDRGERISTSRATAKDGRWRAELLLPNDISGNYSPALITVYAASDDGRDASGSTENLYIYGWSENTDEDTEGPIIQNLWLGEKDFTNGDVVAEGATLHAEISDESGIYLGTGTIGRSMTIEIDGGDLIMTDVAAFCTPVADDPSSVSLAYTLPDLQPGTHSLTLKVWDNSRNSSTASLDFGISARGSKKDLVVRPDHNPATSGVEFIISGSDADGLKPIKLSVYNLQGHLLWESENVENNISWNLTDISSNRVERGIYIYRVEFIDSDGHRKAVAGRLAVTGQ